ncbi:hypothetical protein JCM3766R1_004887 [Sporobolomyces carnicolor]
MTSQVRRRPSRIHHSRVFSVDSFAPPSHPLSRDNAICTMLVDPSKHAVFPVEVMDQIFRSSCLRPGDLARCCLLARRYLSAARKWLYHDVTVTIVRDFEHHGLGTPEDETSDDEWDVYTFYSSRTVALIGTIQNNPALARLIRKVKFAEAMWGQSETRVSEEEAVVEMLKLASMVTAVDFDESCETTEWLENVIPQLGRGTYARCHDASFDLMKEPEFAFVSKLKNLRSLNISAVGTGWQSSQRQLSTTCLETLSINYVRNPSAFSIAEFVAPSALTLRNLKVNVIDLARLDLGAYPNLRRVELLFQSERPTDENPFNRREFSQRFRRCDNLTTIVFRGRTVPAKYEDDVFGGIASGGLQDFGSNSLPQLRRIEFPDGFSIDQLFKFFDDVKYRYHDARPVIECGISSTCVNDVKLQIMRLICENAGVKLILLD